MTSQPGSAIHALPNISKRESDNEIWSANRIQHEKLFFLKIIHKKCGGKTILKSFSKKRKLRKSLDH